MSLSKAGTRKILLSLCNVTVMRMIVMNTCASNTHQLGALITALGQRWVVRGKTVCHPVYGSSTGNERPTPVRPFKET